MELKWRVCPNFFYAHKNISEFCYHMASESEIWMFLTFPAGCCLSLKSLSEALCVSAQILHTWSLGWPHAVRICVHVCVWFLARESGQAWEHRNMKCLAAALQSSPSSQVGIQHQATHTYQNMHTTCQWHLCDTSIFHLYLPLSSMELKFPLIIVFYFVQLTTMY